MLWNSSRVMFRWVSGPELHKAILGIEWNRWTISIPVTWNFRTWYFRTWDSGTLDVSTWGLGNAGTEGRGTLERGDEGTNIADALRPGDMFCARVRTRTGQTVVWCSSVSLAFVVSLKDGIICWWFPASTVRPDMFACLFYREDSGTE